MITLKKSLLVSVAFSLVYGVSVLAVCTKYKEYSEKMAAARESVAEIESSLRRLNALIENGDIDIFTRKEAMQDRAARQAELQEVKELEAKLQACIEYDIN